MKAPEIIIIVALFFISGVFMGLAIYTTSLMNDCNAFGKFRVGETVFTCSKERQQ